MVGARHALVAAFVGWPAAMPAPTATDIYRNVLNVEAEASLPAQVAIHASLPDLLADTSPLSLFTPGRLFARNIVGAGAAIILDPAGWALMLVAGLGRAAIRMRREAGCRARRGPRPP
jgi:hypothetical protein